MPARLTSLFSAASLGAALFLSSCASASLDGDWEGTIDCGSGGGELNIELEIDEDGEYDYDSEGEITQLSLNGVATVIELELSLFQTRTRGGQTVDVEADCTARPASGDAYSIDCDDFSELGWDGEDLLAAEVEDFLDADLDCDIEIER
jgi:hypothetical protein